MPQFPRVGLAAAEQPDGPGGVYIGPGTWVLGLPVFLAFCRTLNAIPVFSELHSPYMLFPLLGSLFYPLTSQISAHISLPKSLFLALRVRLAASSMSLKWTVSLSVVRANTPDCGLSEDSHVASMVVSSPGSAVCYPHGLWQVTDHYLHASVSLSIKCSNNNIAT